MSAITSALNLSFLAAFEGRAAANGPLHRKPLDVNLVLPLPPRVRLYIYSLVGGRGTARGDEYKASVRLRGQRKGQYASFDHSGDRLVVVAAYSRDLDVFVLWDPCLHPQFTNGTNFQVRSATVLTAAGIGFATQRRYLPQLRTHETILACQSASLAATLERRMALLAGDSGPDAK